MPSLARSWLLLAVVASMTASCFLDWTRESTVGQGGAGGAGGGGVGGATGGQGGVPSGGAGEGGMTVGGGGAGGASCLTCEDWAFGCAAQSECPSPAEVVCTAEAEIAQLLLTCVCTVCGPAGTGDCPSCSNGASGPNCTGCLANAVSSDQACAQQFATCSTPP